MVKIKHVTAYCDLLKKSITAPAKFKEEKVLGNEFILVFTGLDFEHCSKCGLADIDCELCELANKLVR